MSENECLISFCLPVYNVSKYIDACLKSIMNRNNTNYEILCIDDCSSDDSYSVIERCAANNPRIRLFRNTHNLGVSNTRNRLINEAKGRYIWFVDPDDMILVDKLEYMIGLLESSGLDVLLFDYIHVKEEQQETEIIDTLPEYRILTNVDLDVFKDYSSHNFRTYRNGLCGVCCGLFRREFLILNHIFFREELYIGEDIIFHYDCLMKIDSYIRVKYPAYNYRIRSGSAVNSVASETRNKHLYFNTLNMSLLIRRFLMEKYYNTNNNYTCKDWLERFLSKSQTNAVTILVKIRDKEFKKIHMKQLRNIDFYPCHFKTILRSSPKSIWRLLYLILINHKIGFNAISTLYRFKEKNEIRNTVTVSRPREIR